MKATLLVLAVLVGPGAQAQGGSDLAAWLARYGEPSRTVVESDQVRDQDEPLLLYWMQTEAAPLGLGPTLPGTLVANFQGTVEEGRIQGFTFLGLASAEQGQVLESELRRRDLVDGEALVQRSGGNWKELTVHLADGMAGVVAFKQDAAGGVMADGRPSPSVWMSMRQPER